MFHYGTWKKKCLTGILLLILFISAVFPAYSEAVLFSAPLAKGTTQNGMVRVRLSSLGNPSSLKLTVNGSYTINGKTEKAIASGSVLQVGFSSGSGKLTLTHNGTTVDMGNSFKLRRHAADGSNGIKIAQGRVPGNLYPGDFEFIAKRNSNGSYALYVIVHVYIEDYLYGVLPYEMGNSSGLEALKAQAVSARTYTMRAMSGSVGREYDVVDTTSDQVYSGTPSGNANCKSAVDATKGIVSKNGSSFTATYYSASNGGQTESIKNAWGTTSHSYLKVKDDPYDLANPDAKKKTFTVKSSGMQDNATLQSLLNNKASAKFGTGAKVTGVTSVTPHTPKYPSPSKLYTKLDFSVRYTRNGITQNGVITFDIFNELEAPLGMSINSGSNELWSVAENGDGFTVYARRYGHGIGMSQRGAMYMAQLGYTYDQILGFYFEGCTRVQYTFTRSILSPVINGQQSSEETIVEHPAEIEQEQGYQALIMRETALLDAANAGANAMMMLPAGAKVKVCKQENSYYLVVYGSLCGYIAADDANHDGSATGDNVTPTKLYGYGTVVNSNALNLRTSPSTTNSTVMTTVPGKTVLPVFSVTGNWAYVQYGLRTGYVSLDYIDMNLTGNPLPSATPVLPQNPSLNGMLARVTTKKGSLNLRQDDASNATILTTIPQYTVINVLQKGKIWSKVTYGNHTGYVMTEFLTFLENTAPATQAPAPTAAPETPDSAEFARVTTASGSLNLRDGRSNKNKVLRTIPQYAVVEVLEKYTDWYKVTYNGTTGYAMSKFLTLMETAVMPTQAPLSTATPLPAATPLPTPSHPVNDGNSYAKVMTVQGSLNLRKTKNGRVLRTIPQYATVQVLNREGTWCKVKYEGTEGYVMTSFLSFISAPAATPEPVFPHTPLPQITPIPTQAPSHQIYDTATVTTASGSLNLRKTQNGRVLRTIPQNALVTVISRGNSWTKVRYEGTEGYVMTTFLTFHPVMQATPVPATAVPPASTPVPNGTIICYAIVNTGSGTLNLRKNADTDAKVLATIPGGTRIPVYQKGTVWCKVRYNGETGYVQTGYLNFDDQLALPATPAPEQSIPETDIQYIDPTMKQLDTVILGRANPEGSFLNLRAYCSTASEAMDEIPKNTYVLITAVGEEWCQVIHEDKTGYCLEKYLEYVKP